MAEESNDDLIYVNGIDGETGEPLLPPLTVEMVAQIAQGNPIDEEDLAELRERDRMLKGEADYGVMAGIDTNDLAQAGWGVIFAFEDAESGQLPAIKEALKPLLDLRRAQAQDRYRDEAVPRFFYRPRESKNAWLTRNGGAPGPVDPQKVPYYLLIVGDPEKIPYRFQYQLDVAHAVGRIHFDTIEEYHNYARSVVAAEVGDDTPLVLSRNAAFFGVLNGRDRATNLSVENLVKPLATLFGEKYPDWNVKPWLEDEASKDQLARLLGGDDTPAFLFSASHGMGFGRPGHERQREEQGAIVCSDWRGVGPVREDMKFIGEDIGDDARLLGMIAFLFACYGAGTPQYDDFAIRTRDRELKAQGVELTGLEQYDPIEIAPQPFVARLPQRLLGHPKGGALATVGHVDRAWGVSFRWEGSTQLTTFESTLTKLWDGDRLGFALEDFDNRYAELSTELTARIQAIKFREIVPPEELARLWTVNNDARSYVIIGDPAVKLPVNQNKTEADQHPELETVTLVTTAKMASTEQGEDTMTGTEETGAVSPDPEIDAALASEMAAATTTGVATGLFGGDDEDYAIRESLRDARDRLIEAVQEFADKLGQALEKAVDDASSLEVTTYVSDDMSKVTRDFEQTASLRAYTRINIDGDTSVVVPKQKGEVDKDLWAIHVDMVRQAQENRTEMIKAGVVAATSLLDALKVL